MATSTPGRTLRLATRGSAQATAQATAVADALMAAHAGLVVQLVFVETLGDQRTDVPAPTPPGYGRTRFTRPATEMFADILTTSIPHPQQDLLH